MRRIFYLFLLIFATMACRTHRPIGSASGAKEALDSTDILLNLGQTQFLKPLGIHVTFTHVLEDSRCPKGMHCIWAGVAAVEVSVMGIYTRPQTLRLATTALPAKGYETMQRFNEYMLRMNALEPYPHSSSDTTRQPPYQLRITIIKQ
ncbi:hypothetical protein [Sphingobacterium suaedae]|uniref:Uncharacterized protein n=1 Tax=Sphingobacterium suaedae TaxID=1686402 RepID=A0ABW5KG45_9SPHI